MNTIREQDLVALDDLERKALERLLADQNISLKPNELDRVRELLGRNPTLVELHIFNTMWSEHCSYKSSKAVLKEHLPTEAPHVVLGPGEDAGIVRFFEKAGKTYCLVMAHESHNHPSQVLPVEGAATGIGGIVRDVYCMGADVIGVMDPLRFGDPEGQNGQRVRTIVRGVVEGISQYANALGVPNLGGDTYFDASYDDNCLVNVVALGVVEEKEIIRSRAPEAAQSAPHDIILIGKPTDASGFGGAAFASERLSGDEAEERQEAVQVPDPFLKRVLTEATKVVLKEAMQRGIPIGFKDLGAGGISCAVSEMAHAGGVGAALNLDDVNTSSEALPPEVISCSETQERYAMIVPSEFTADVLEIYNEDFELPHIYTGAGARVIGRTTADGRFKLCQGDRMLCDAETDAITAGIAYEREAAARRPRTPASPAVAPPPTKDALRGLLSTYNIADKSILFQHYDMEVQGRAVLRPGEADAAVAVFVPGETVGVAAGIGGCPSLGAADPYLGGVWAVCEAVRNVACVGGRALAITDCLNYGDPEDPSVFWEFSEGVRGIGDACRHLRLQEKAGAGVPVISGNVSFYNQSGLGEAIAPSPIVACAGRVDDISVCRGMGFKRNGSPLVLLGALHDRLGGSEYQRCFRIGGGHTTPGAPDFESESLLIRMLLRGFEHGSILAAHDISHGGLAVTVSEMILAGGLSGVGCVLDVTDLVSDSPADPYLFSEYGGVVVEIDESRWREYRGTLEAQGARWYLLGRTTDTPRLEIRTAAGNIEVSLGEIRTAHRLSGRCNPLFE
jgi:phosphoribosylformylglycinamidine synthase